ncbi:outer membrane protein [Taklimakanibacter lacteus]|uniref:outer membrane protein n=1 Tax=Taklimakanibacter lacteus TaxID=2268456 RepID=UPI000E66DB19
MLKKALSAGTVSVFMVGNAFAADIEAPTVHDWTGFYIGATAGYGWGDTRQTTADPDPGQSDDETIDGFVGGAAIGYNWQLDSILLGLETDISYSDIAGEFDGTPQWGCGVPDECSTDVPWFGTVRLRAGLPIDTILPYITAGMAFAEIEGKIDLGPIPPQNGRFDGSDTVFGWTIGGGVEWALDDSVSVKVEYLWIDLEEADLGEPRDFSGSADFSLVRGGVNFRF